MTQPRNWYRARTLAALGHAVRGAREDTGLTQAQFAVRLGTSRATISRIERGSAVSVDVVLAALAAGGYEIAVVPREATVQVGD
jgi:transcriptional regulator with XRE-family HTH domain